MDYSFQYVPLTSEGSDPSQFNRFQIATVMREFWDTHLSVWGVTQPTPTLPPVDYSFQYALLTVTDDGSNPSQLNRFWMAIKENLGHPPF